MVKRLYCRLQRITMITAGRRNSFLLFCGDIVSLIFSLYVTLWLRYQEIPDAGTLIPYVAPFTLLFAIWALVFYSAGLYGKRLALFPSRLPDVLLKVQMVNILVAAIFFFLIPSFGITPKTILVLYLFVSLGFIFIWRMTLYPYFSVPRTRERAILFAEGIEADALVAEVNGNPRYGIELITNTDNAEDGRTALYVVSTARAGDISLSELVRSGKQVVSFEDFYEEVFDRIPLSLLNQSWFGKHVASEDSILYASTKRLLDIVGGSAMAVITLLIAPLIFIANLFEGSGPLFIRQERLGRYGTRVSAFKFRSMQKNLPASNRWISEGENRITRVGAFLRVTSLDEFPQCINILRGEISLIGPRNDILGLGERLAEALPYYMERYLVVPGITGWAQVNQQYEQGNVSPQSIEETKVRLAYDFYYLKHRSLGLDVVIALRTIKRMFFRMSPW
jgi:lipopolysaccharide/colanic/teichoic acid biosynthesis glycosyltransferase